VTVCLVSASQSLLTYDACCSADGCSVQGCFARKTAADHTWTVVLAKDGVKVGRRLWELRVSGRTGRMAIGVCQNVEQVSNFQQCRGIERLDQLAALPEPPILILPATGSQSARWLGKCNMRWQSLVLFIDRWPTCWL
jgi:hypothetical protein